MFDALSDEGDDALGAVFVLVREIYFVAEYDEPFAELDRCWLI